MEHIRLPFDLDLKETLKVLQEDKALTLVNPGNLPAKTFLVKKYYEGTGCRAIFWASADEQADVIAHTTGVLFPGDTEIIPEEIDARSLYRVFSTMKGEVPSLFLFQNIGVTLEQQFPTWKDIQEKTLSLKVGEEVQIYEFFESLQSRGYSPAEDPNHINRGEYLRKGESLFFWPVQGEQCVRCTLFGTEVESIETIDQQTKDVLGKHKTYDIYPANLPEGRQGFFDLLREVYDEKILLINDDLDQEHALPKVDLMITFTSFPKNEERFFHMNFFSVLPFYTIPDFVMDIKDRLRREFHIVIATKKLEEVENICKEAEIMITRDTDKRYPSTVQIIEVSHDAFLPHSFQNNTKNIVLLTDREIFQFTRSSRQKKAIAGMNVDLINALKPGDYVVHTDHGLGKFESIIRRELGGELGTREYLKVAYAQGDRLFVPVESTEKITKFIGDEAPKLTRLGAADWKKSQRKLKEETKKVAEELLKLYAAREMSKRKAFAEDDEMMKNFCESFPYEPTPGQAQTWSEIRRDMESARPMDRLVCGDVGFGKTEMAMRAAFKCFRSGRQAAILAPITILAEQHYQNFLKRIAGKEYGLNVALLSRFQSKKEQEKILKDLETGLVDIVIGTHRLLSEDIKFHNIGILIIDEEQRFGVKQKEKLKKLRANVDVLTMTATPIPRTLNMGLNKLRDISTITTPPPGRLPVVTEVRKYNLNLVRERILAEIERGGQVYLLHNEVKSIEGFVAQLQSLIPEVRFIIGHGQLTPQELEKRINAFKNKEADVLVASTIIENGIDLSNANTLIVNRAEKFGLSQLYQLRGRVGRGRVQAYAYFLYHGQKLEVEAKKRLRAIVEASELGSGFQIAMRDLEIRGAGEILGASQSGTMKTVGVSHFVRVLHQMIEKMKKGEISADDIDQEEENISVEVPLSAYIPSEYIPAANEKIQVYQELASAKSKEQLQAVKDDIEEDYGKLPEQVQNLCKVIELKIAMRAARLAGVKINKASHKSYEIIIRMGQGFTPDQIFGLLQHSTSKWTIMGEALKMTQEKLPVNWYQMLLDDIKLIMPPKKKQTKKS